MSGTNSWAAASVKPMLTTSMEVISRLEANAPDDRGVGRQHAGHGIAAHGRPEQGTQRRQNDEASAARTVGQNAHSDRRSAMTFRSAPLAFARPRRCDLEEPGGLSHAHAQHTGQGQTHEQRCQ